MKDFILQDLQKTNNKDDAIYLNGYKKEYIILKQDDVIIVNDSVKNRDGAIFLTQSNEKICFLDDTLEYNKLFDIASNNQENKINVLEENEIFKIELLSGIKNNMIFTKEFNKQASISSKQIGDFLGNNYVLKKTIQIKDYQNKIFFLKDILKSQNKINLNITLENYEQSKDSIGFDGNINEDFIYKYSVFDENLIITIDIEKNSKDVLDRFYYEYTSNDDFKCKKFNICINNNILYEVKITKKGMIWV